MNLTYITCAKILARDAQAVQIKAMARAFHANTQTEFLLISPVGNSQVSTNALPFCWHAISGHFRGRSLLSLEVFLRTLSEVRRRKTDVVMTRDTVFATLYSLLGYPVIYEAHKAPSRFAGLLLRLVVQRKRNRILAISRSLQDYLVNVLHLRNREALFSSHDGAFPEDYEGLRKRMRKELRQSLGLPLDQHIVLYTGSLYKGKDALLFRAVLEYPKKVHFYCIGGREEDVAKYREIYRDYANIVFLPHLSHEKVMAYQAAADLLFYPLTKSNPLWQFTSPLKLFEYMASGTPILGSNIGSVAEVLNQENAFIFDPDSPGSIREALDTYFDDLGERQRRAATALRQINE